MKVDKRAGIWMDHASANLTEFTVDPMETTTIEAPLNHHGQPEKTTYYKKIGEAIRHFDDVILFGPTEAKSELLNTLKENHHFANIKIEAQQADKMNEHQQQAFVKAYFKRH